MPGGTVAKVARPALFVMPLRVQIRLGLRDRDVGAGHRGAALIAHVDDERAVEHLRLRRPRVQADAGDHQGPQQRTTQQGPSWEPPSRRPDNLLFYR